MAQNKGPRPTVYGQLIYDKGDKNIQGSKIV